MAIDITGQRFGRLLAVAPTSRLRDGRVVWRFECDCGGIALTTAKQVRSGKARSCGCLRSELTGLRSSARRRPLCVDGVLTGDALRLALHYDQDTGVFTRLMAFGASRIGEEAGTLDDRSGYRKISVNGKQYTEHRLAWLYMTGEWPADEIDHINGARGDNRWSNLRAVDHQTNMQNMRSPMVTNASGFLGVSREAATGKFRASMTVDDRHIHLGRFDRAEDAHQHYLNEKRKRHEGCTI